MPNLADKFIDKGNKENEGDPSSGGRHEILSCKMVDRDCLGCFFPLVEFGNGLTAKRSVSPSPCPDTDCGPLSF